MLEKYFKKKKKKVPEYINKTYTPCAEAAKHFILKCSSPYLRYVSTKQLNAFLVVEYESLEIEARRGKSHRQNDDLKK